MGFNAMQPGKIKRGDIVMLVAAIVVVAGVGDLGGPLTSDGTRATSARSTTAT